MMRDLFADLFGAVVNKLFMQDNVVINPLSLSFVPLFRTYMYI